MKNSRYTKKRIRITACFMAASIIFSQSTVSMATEDESHLNYITDIAELTEQDMDLNFEEKPSLDDLQDVLPDTLTVVLDGKSNTTKIDVDWECETDYESEWSGKGQESYTFIPEWDESVYALADVENGRIEIPVIRVSIGADRESPSQIEDLETAQEELQGLTRKKSILALVYLCDRYEVRDIPSEEGSTVVSVVSGQSVQIEDVDLDEEGNVWYKVTFYQQDKDYAGYIEEKYLATSDEDFLGWTDEYVEEEEISPDKPKTLSAVTVADYPDINQFPASYQNSLRALKQQYPKWIFVKMETGLDYNMVVSNEMKNDRSWISSSKPGSWQNGAAAQSGWSLASEGILRYYMDPRNFLTESAIFQFEQLTYNASYHTESAVQAIVASSFMSGDIPGENMTYAKAFTKIGEELKISPFHLASRVLQEQGTNGTSPIISGKVSGFEGYYNYFNVGASGNDANLILNGLKKAQEYGWNTRYKSLYGGASIIGQNYILRGQDTLYLQKFNVTSNNTYNHQYMQNIMAPASEAPNIKKAYGNTGSLNNSFVFKIPVYSNMPASACPLPDSTDNITLNKSTISSLAVDKTEKLIPYVNGSKVDSLNGMTFTSSNTGVATVDAQGLIKAVSPGTAKITCARSGANSASCTVTVVQAEPVVDSPVLSPVVYKKGLKLSDIDLPERWSWSKGSTLLEAGTASYEAVYTPADTTRYLTVKRQIGLKVTQAIPSCTVPENLTAKLGSKLGSIELPTGFSWESDEETILDKTGEKTFYLSYDPNDKNYLELNHIPVVVKVTGDSAEPKDPEDQGGSLPGGDSGNGGGGSSGSSSSSGTSSTGSGNGTGSGGSTTGGDNSGTGSGTSGTGGSGGTGSDGSMTGGDNSGTGSGTSGTGGSTGAGSTGSNGGTGSDGSTTGGDNSNTGSGAGSTGSGNTGSGTGSTGSGNTGSGTSGTGGSTGAGSTGSGSGTDSGNGSTGSSGGTGSDGNTTGSGSSNTGSGAGGTGGSAGTDSGTGSTGSGSGTDSGSGSSNTDSGTGSSDSGELTSSGGSATNSGGNSTSKPTSDNNHADTNSKQEKDTVVNVDSVNGSTEDDNSGVDTNSSPEKSGSDGDNASDGSNNANNGGGVDKKQNSASGNITSGSNHSTLPVDSNPVIKADEDKAEDTEDAEEPVYERPAVTMDMEDAPILTTEMLQMAKEQNVDLLLKMNNRASWHVNVGTVQGKLSDIDMNVVFDRNVVPEDLLASWAQENDYLEFTLAHDGPFGFGAQLEVLLNPEDSGRYANLFYYDSEADTLEFICACVIDENGYAVFSMEHASSYVIIISDFSMAGMPMPEVNTEPESDSGSALGWIVLGVAIPAVSAVFGTAGYFYLRRRREEDEDVEDEDDEYDSEEYDSEDEDEEYDSEEYDAENEEYEKDDELEGEEVIEEDDAEYIEDYEDDEEENTEESSTDEVLQQDVGPIRNEKAVGDLTEFEEEANMGTDNDEDDWIEDEEWQEPEKSEAEDLFADDHAEDDWIEDDEWDISNDWMDDEEWAKKSNLKKTAV